jgi:hypothetical protein
VAGVTITFTGRAASTGLSGFNQETGSASGFAVVADPLGLNGNVIRARLAFGDSLAGGSHRSELNIDPIRTAVGSAAWYWWSVYIPADWTVGGNPTVVWQVHDTPDGGDAARRPPIECDIEGDEVVIWSSAATSAGNDAQVNRIIWRAPLADHLGVWVDWVVGVTLNYTSSGALSIWRDRRKVFVETGQKNCYNDVAGLYPKFGVYTPDDLSAEIPLRTVYHQGLVVGDSAYATYNAFAAAASIPTELEMVTPCRLAVA